MESTATLLKLPGMLTVSQVLPPSALWKNPQLVTPTLQDPEVVAGLEQMRRREGTLVATDPSGPQKKAPLKKVPQARSGRRSA